MTRSHLLSVIEAARSKEKHPDTVRRAVTRGDLRCSREPHTGKILIDPADLREWYEYGLLPSSASPADDVTTAALELAVIALERGGGVSDFSNEEIETNRRDEIAERRHRTCSTTPPPVRRMKAVACEFKFTVDPEFSAFLPAMTEEEYSQLEANIIANGCRDPLVVWNNVIVDGHNRYEICKRNNIPHYVVVKDFADRDEAKAWIIQNQFGRRNLSNYQRAELALLLEPLIAKKAKENQGLSEVAEKVRRNLQTLIPRWIPAVKSPRSPASPTTPSTRRR